MRGSGILLRSAMSFLIPNMYTRSLTCGIPNLWGGKISGSSVMKKPALLSSEMTTCQFFLLSARFLTFSSIMNLRSGFALMKDIT